MSTVAERRRAFIVGIAGGALVTYLLAGMWQRGAGTPQSSETIGHLAPVIDIQKDGPLLGGDRLTLESAEQLTPYRLPVPPMNADTGNRTGIWIDSTKQVAFVWDTDLRFYAERLRDWTQAEAISTWTEKTASGQGRLVDVLGTVGIGYDDGPGGDPSSLTFIHDGLSLQFVAPNQTLDQLSALAGNTTFEQS